MTLIKTSLLSLIATIFKVSYGLIINKLLAVYMGPSGIALVGQFQSVQSGMLGIATAGLGQGLTKYLSEFRGDVKKNAPVFATAVKLELFFLLPVSVGLFVFSDWLSDVVFHSNEASVWLSWLAISIIPASLGALFVAALNGLGEIRSLTLVGVLSSCLGIVLSILLVPLWGVGGVVASLLLTPVLVVFVSMFYLHKSTLFSWEWVKVKVNREDTKCLGKFTLMALASAIAIPVSHILIRNILTDQVSIDAAGLWTGMWRISEAYLMVITMTLSVYYLPKLSGLKTSKDVKHEIRQGQYIILPLVLLSALILFFLKDWVIRLLFSASFYDMRELFAFQLVGDFIKIASWLYAYLMLAKAKVGIFICTEVGFSVLFVLLSTFFIGEYGLVGMSYAFAVNYTLYLFLIIWWFYRSCEKGVFDEVNDVSHS